MGVQFPEKKRYVTLEWPQVCSFIVFMNVLSLLLNYGVLNILFTKLLRHIQAYNMHI